MALSTRAIRTKIKSVNNIRKITKAMEMVSASKMRRAVSRALATRAYTEASMQLLTTLLKDEALAHPLMEPREEGRSLIIAIGSNRGLCGGFNVTLARAVTRFVRETLGDRPADLIAIGRNAERLAVRLEKGLIGSFSNISEHSMITDIAGIRRLVLDEFQKGSYGRVYVAYMNYISPIKYEPIIRQLLPFEFSIGRNILEEIGDDRKAEDFRAPDTDERLFEPGKQAVLDAILPRLFEINVYQALLESFASEHSARMFAMKNASDNAKVIVEDLTLSYNNVRQSGITREISEIAAGADALNVD